MDATQKTWIVVCRTGRGYTMEHAAVQRRQFMAAAGEALDRGWKFVCLTDRPSEDWHIPLISNNQGWWALVEMFRFQGPHILTGLDTILLRDLDPLMQFAEQCPPDILYGIRDFYFPKRWASGVTLWNGDWSELFHLCGPEDMARFRGDQDFIEDAVQTGRVKGQLGYLQDHMKGHIISFKADLRRYARLVPAPNARVCCFHGTPRPWDIAGDYPWAAEALTLPPLPDEQPARTPA